MEHPVWELGRLLAQLMHRHSLGYVNGAGLVLFPRHYNLLYHCFGETGASRPSTNTGVTLPWQDRAYAADQGSASLPQPPRAPAAEIRPPHSGRPTATPRRR